MGRCLAIDHVMRIFVDYTWLNFLDDFREYYEAEVRNQLLKMDRWTYTNRIWSMIKMKRPTAPNKSRHTERYRINRNFSGKFKQLIFINIKNNSENIRATKFMFDKLNSNSSPL